MSLKTSDHCDAYITTREIDFLFVVVDFSLTFADVLDRKMMYSRLVFRSIQSSMMVNRFLSFSQVQSAAATKLKEKLPTTDKVDQPSTPKIPTKSIEDQKPIPPPSLGLVDPNKTYSEKIQRLVDEISKLSLVDVMDLNELLKVDRTFD